MIVMAMTILFFVFIILIRSHTITTDLKFKQVLKK